MAVHPRPEKLLGHHLKYEIDMLRETLARLPSSTDRVITNALIESYCVHARSLIEFFRKRRSRAAQDYVRPALAYKPFTGTQGRVDDLWLKLNNQISHLMDGRTDDDSKKLGDGERRELYELIRGALAHFKANLRPEYQNIDIGELPTLTVQPSPMNTASVTTTIAIVTGSPISTSMVIRG
jgi:hypothetical protein